MMTAKKDMMQESAPAQPKVRMRAESENSSVRNDRQAVPSVSTQAGPTVFSAYCSASILLGALDEPVAHREDDLHAVGEAHHHDERAHHVEEQVER